MRTSGADRDTIVILIPVIILVAVGVVLSGDSRSVFGTLERQLWRAVEGLGGWLGSFLS
jgi:hypothetical protein